MKVYFRRGSTHEGKIALNPLNKFRNSSYSTRGKLQFSPQGEATLMEFFDSHVKNAPRTKLVFVFQAKPRAYNASVQPKIQLAKAK